MFFKILGVIIVGLMTGIIFFVGIGSSILMFLDEKKKEDK